jgi:hypothetical protein
MCPLSFYAYSIFEGTFTSFFGDKVKKEVTKQKKSRFFFAC